MAKIRISVAKDGTITVKPKRSREAGQMANFVGVYRNREEFKRKFGQDLERHLNGAQEQK